MAVILQYIFVECQRVVGGGCRMWKYLNLAQMLIYSMPCSHLQIPDFGALEYIYNINQGDTLQ